MKHSKDEKQDSPFMRQTTEAILCTDLISNPCPSLHNHSWNPLHYRRLLLLSIRSGYIRKLVDGFLSRLFLLSRMLNEQKNTYRSGTKAWLYRLHV